MTTIPPSTPSGPGFDTDLIPEEDSEPIGPDDWYSVRPDGEIGSDLPAAPAGATSGENLASLQSLALRNQVFIGLALILILAAALALLYWRRRRIEKAEPVTEGPSLAFGVHRIIAGREAETASEDPTSEDDAPASDSAAAEPIVAPEPIAAPAAAPTPSPPVLPREPARIDLAVDIIGATRSVMMFTLEFQVEIANRSGHAVRDVNVSAQLASAQRGGSNAPTVAGGQPISEVERIGPHQSRRVTGRLQIPLSDLHPIQQGSTPLFIPLLHVTVEGDGVIAMDRSFVVGAPSTASQGRVHPLPLSGPPGGLPPLRAQLIKQELGGKSEQDSGATAPA